VLDSIIALADFLVSEVRITERGSEQAKRDAKEAVPADRIKDAAAMARELRWRVKQAAGYGSDDEGTNSKTIVNGCAHGVKRKRVASEPIDVQTPRFKNYRPRRWECVMELPSGNEKLVLNHRKPRDDEDKWYEGWTEWEAKEMGDGEEEVEVSRKREVIVKVGKTSEGLERHRIERVVEEWKWGESKHQSSSSSVTTG
jgi:hypothetical protein